MIGKIAAKLRKCGHTPTTTPMYDTTKCFVEGCPLEPVVLSPKLGAARCTIHRHRIDARKEGMFVLLPGGEKLKESKSEKW